MPQNSIVTAAKATSKALQKRTEAVKELTGQLQARSALHEAVYDWFLARKDLLNLSQIARRVGEDTSFLRKVITGERAPVRGHRVQVSDIVLQEMIKIISELGVPLQIPGSIQFPKSSPRKKSAK